MTKKLEGNVGWMEIKTREIVSKWKDELKVEVEILKSKGVYPKLTIVQDSQTQEECARYKKGKYSCAKELGIECEDIIIETEGKSKSLILRDLESNTKLFLVSKFRSLLSLIIIDIL